MLIPTDVGRGDVPLSVAMTTGHSNALEQEADREPISDLTPAAWKGIAAEIRARIQNGSFGERYPATCPDGTVPYGTDEEDFWGAVAGEVPELAEGEMVVRKADPPSVGATMALIEFCWRAVAKPTQIGYHSFFDHYHLRFDVGIGRREFRKVVNRIFERNTMGYRLTEKGSIERLLSGDVSPAVCAEYHTGDNDLDEMLERARQKFLSVSDVERREALQALWDAWERLKTLGGKDKKSGISDLLDRAAGAAGSKLRSVLEDEARKLTEIGNSFQIRHSETSQERLELAQHIDYVARRMFSFIYLIIGESHASPKERSDRSSPWGDELPF